MQAQNHLRGSSEEIDQLCQQTRGSHSNNPGGCSKNHHTCALAPITVVTSHNIIPATTSTTITTTTPAGMTITTMQLDKWVKNLLGVPLTDAQVSLLAHGPNFAVAPRHPYRE